MLILSRKLKESFVIGGNIELTVLDIQGEKVRIGINAPKEIPIVRKEIIDTEKQNKESAKKVDRKSLEDLNDMVKK